MPIPSYKKYNTLCYELMLLLYLLDDFSNYLDIYFKVFGAWYISTRKLFKINSITSYQASSEPQEYNVFLEDANGKILGTQLRLPDFDNYNTRPKVISAREGQPICVYCTYGLYEIPSLDYQSTELCCTGGYVYHPNMHDMNLDCFNDTSYDSVLDVDVEINNPYRSRVAVGFKIKPLVDNKTKNRIIRTLYKYNSINNTDTFKIRIDKEIDNA